MRNLLPMLLSLPLVAHASDLPPPITDAERAVLSAIPQDKAPKKLNATRPDLEGRHYLSGDEANLHLFHPRIKDLGGAYAGVGSDQAYLFAGWIKPRFAFVTDYDPWIQWLHLSYAAFFEKAETIDEFLGYWKDTKAGLEVIGAHYKDHDKLNRRARFVYAQGAHKASRRLRRLRKWSAEHEVPSFLSDPAMYDYVRAMVRGGRVIPLVCNLLDKKCLVGLGEATRALKVPLRVLYTSNAEQYWNYKQQFRANIQAQNFDEKSLVLRTLASKRSANKDYHYHSQPGLNFQAWLEHAWVKQVRTIVPLVYVKDPDHLPLTHEDRDPDVVKAERDAKKARKKRK